jgi:hypothetical protein
MICRLNSAKWLALVPEKAYKIQKPQQCSKWPQGTPDEGQMTDFVIPA